MTHQSSRAVRSAATAIALMAAAGAVTVSHSSHAQSQPPAVQWRVQGGGNGHWYQFVPYGVLATWQQAVSYAAARGGHLATIRSSGEQTFAYQLTASGSCEPAGTIWLGADQPPGTAPNVGWRWISGEPWGYTNWSPGEPNDFQGWQEDCLVMLHPGGSWYDIRKDGFASPSCTRAALIEWSADCNNDGIVDYGQCRDGSLPDYNGNNIPDCCEHGELCVLGSYPFEWQSSEGGNGHWYSFERDSPSSWTDARDRATQLGGHLATFSDSAEWTSIRRRFSAGSNYWIGLFQDPPNSPPAANWRWVTGEPVTYTAWGSGEPNDWNGVAQWVAQIQNGGSDWDDASNQCCNVPVVEWDADCNGDGIVDYGQILRGQLGDANGDGIPNICQCAGDVTANNTVDGVDLAAVLGAWGTNGQGQFMTDIDGDGIVGGTDLAYVLSGWGACPE